MKKASFKNNTLYTKLFNSIKDCVALYEVVDDGEDFKFVDLNKAAEEAESIKKKDIVGKLVTEVFPGVKEFGIFQVFQEVYKDGAFRHFPMTFYSDSRISGWRDNYIYKLDENHIFAVYNDVTKEKQAEAELKLAAKVFDTSLEGILITDKNTKVLKANKAFYEMSGFSEEEVFGKKANIMGSKIHSKEFYKKMWQSLEEKGFWSGEIWNRKKDGTAFAVFLNINVVNNEKGEIENYVAIYLDITEQKRAQEKITRLAYTDTLTKLPNRVQFETTLEHSIERAKRLNLKVGLVFMDLDNFKYVNDTYGHDYGDRLLIEVSKRLIEIVRASDLLARIGGDEFVIILDEIKDEEELAELAQRLLLEFKENFYIKDIEADIGCSIGLSIFPDDADSKHAFIKNADTAMYHAKESGKNRFMFFSPEMNEEFSRRLKLTSYIKQGLENKEFEVYYQPKVFTKSGRIQGAEALIRWNSKELGFVSPAEFIPFAEETGLIIPMGDYVMESVFRVVKEFEQKGLDDLVISINISSVQLEEDDFISKVKNCLELYNCNPELLEFEITESKIMSNIKENIEKLLQLKELGISLSIDDFGTGYSSMNYLNKMPIDIIKIDKSFIDNVPKESESNLLIQGIISLAKALSLKLVAEGVETQDQNNYLKELECDLIQGYLYSKPLSKTDFFEYLNNVKVNNLF